MGEICISQGDEWDPIKLLQGEQQIFSANLVIGTQQSLLLIIFSHNSKKPGEKAGLLKLNGGQRGT